MRAWLIEQLCRRLGLQADAFDTLRPFRDYGLDSLAATRLIADLGATFDRQLSPTLMWEFPTVEALAARLADSEEPRPAASAVAAARASEEPIAIVGMACRFPGAETVEAFWDLLRNGGDAITDVPPERWDPAQWCDNGTAPGRIVTRRGGFLRSVDGFDADFFGISPREAAQMDPQQRLMLELSWEGLEAAGIPPDSLRGSRTGVFFGAVWRDYSELQAMQGATPTQHTAAGHAGSIIANRVSYALGLEGPSLAVDTACSSSLVAVHLACRSLLSGESDAALAGGVMLLLSPRTSVSVSAFGGLSPDGVCRTFDARAAGYVRGEGAGVVVLKRLSRALADGDPILCVIRGTAVNNDGATNGLTAPNLRAQEAVLREAWTAAGRDPSQAAFVELHGTGTPLGDPIEARALSTVLCERRSAERPLAVGSVKTNIGHLEGAAGIAGLIKVALAMRHRAIPPSLHFEQPNPLIDFDALRIRVQCKLAPLAPDERPALAGVSSFGFGGTNCHAVVEEYTRPSLVPAPPIQRADGRKMAFVFGGGGSIWPGMARDLMGEPPFYAALKECDDSVRRVAGWSLLETMAAGGPERPNDPAVHLPILFSMQVALARLWQEHGIEPDSVVGYSVGEWAAAHVAGILSVKDGIRIACAYARALQPVSGRAGMGVVGLPSARTRELLQDYDGAIAISAENGPASTGIGGERHAIEELAARLTREGIFCRAVEVDGVAHIPAVEPLLEGFAAECGPIPAAPPRIPMVSTVTGTWLRTDESGGSYWVRNFRDPVAFSQAVETLLAAGHTTFIEMAPHPAHGRDIAAIAAAAGVAAQVAAAMERGKSVLPAGTDPPNRGELLVLSARSPEALAHAARNLTDNPAAAFADICYTAAVRRSHHEYRLAIPAKSLGECIEAGARTVRGRARSGNQPKLAFVFSGQGSLWHGMARQLLASEPAFRAALLRCDAEIRRHTGWSLLDEIAAPAERSRLDDTDVAQPLLFAFQVALAALWRDWGIRPDGVVGHSAGEIAAAHVAGALSLEDAARIVCHRGRLMQAAKGLGAMAAIAAPPERVPDILSVAAINSPVSTVVSGEPEPLAAFLASLQQHDIEHRKLPVDFAFHSPQMDPYVGPLLDTLDGIEPGRPDLALYSTVTGARHEHFEPAYWARNLRETVQFAAAVEQMSHDGYTAFLEIAPHGVLQRPLAECNPAATILPSLRSGAEERTVLLTAVGALYTLGAPIRWDRVFHRGGRVVPLAPYAWQRRRHWFESARALPAIGADPETHPVLGRRVRTSQEAVEYWCEIGEANAGSLADHRIYGTLVVPAASHIARLLCAGQEAHAADGCVLEDLTFPQALVLPAGKSCRLHITTGPETTDGLPCRVTSPDGASWRTHAAGRMRLGTVKSAASHNLDELRRACPNEITGSQLYDALAQQGLHLGPRFQWIETLRAGGGQAFGKMRAPDGPAEPGPLSAGLIDSCFQLLGACLDRRDDLAFVPLSLEAFRYRAAGTPEWCHMRLRSAAGDTATADFRLFDESGQVIAEAAGLTVARAPRHLFLASGDWFHAVRWTESLPVTDTATTPGRCLILSDAMGIGTDLAQHLDAAVIAPGDPLPEPADYDTVIELRALDADSTTQRTLDLVQWLARADFARHPRLVLVTRGAQAVRNEAPAPHQAALWGAANAIEAEHPEWACTRIDLDPENARAEDLLFELSRPDREPRVAYRSGKRHVARIERRPRPASRPPELNPDATYLITGGLGALGLHTARWLVEHGARRLVLMGRGEPSPEAAAGIRGMESAGAAIVVERGDVRKVDDVERIAEGIRRTAHPLRGVIHAAGELADGVLVKQTWERFQRAASAKVEGAWNLHQATESDALDFFVLYSSVASLMPAAGQANYAAGNAFLDAVAHYRRAKGLPAISINWGPWAGAGMAAHLDAERLRAWRERGIVPLAPNDALSALGDLLFSDAVQCAVFQQEKAPPPQARAAAARPWSDVPAAERRRALEQYLREETAALLGLPAGHPIDPERPLRDLGFDSLMALNLRNALGTFAGRTLPATLVFDYPTLAKIADHLMGQTAEPAPIRPAVLRGSHPAYPPDAVAVVGMACRFPGGANDPEAYWRLLRNGVDAISEVPGDRWDVDAYFDTNRDTPGKMYSRWGGFLSEVGGFDAGFFGIAPREARGMDPQQRLLLEVTWEALESAGQPAARLAGTATGVFVGFCLSDYAQKQLYAGDARGIDAYSGTGSVGSVAAGRLSYFLGLQGPSMAVDTACSSSLVSVHLACQSLRAGECEMALAGGVNLLLSPNITVYFSKLTALAPDGRCKAFDAAANGYVRGEGCGMLVLKPLARALADGDGVLAVIRGSAVNQDGRSNGLTAPSGKAQERVIRGALRQAGLSAHDIGYVEAHGTGTPLGDPIEIGALAAALCQDRSTENRLLVGSVKTNIGHLEGAAGVAGLIKAILALRHREIPPHLHLKQKSPHIPWESLPIEVPTAPIPWHAADGTRIAGVSSFGFSGTNAHILLQEAPASGPEPAPHSTRCHPFVLSAKTPAALDALADAWIAFPLPADSFAAAAYTSAVRRTHHEHRLVAAARSPEALREALAAYRSGEAIPAVAVGQAVVAARPRLAFVFSGHGSQWLGMGETLLREEAVFRDAIERCAEALRPHVDWPLVDQLTSDGTKARLSESHIAQPAIFAMQVALAALWRSWGVEPEAVVGHSSGEIAAAYVAGALSLEDAAAIVCLRSRLVQAAAGRGAMLAVELAQADVEGLLDRDRLWLAAVNSPTAFVLSGEADAVEQTGRDLDARGIYCRRVDVDYASHCPLMEPFRETLVRSLNGLRAGQARVPIYSTVTGQPAGAEDFSAEYWGRHLRQPVRFRDSIDALLDAGVDTFLSVDPHAVLAQPLAQCIEARGKSGHVVASGRRNQDPSTAMKTALGRLFALGYAVDWSRQFAEPQRLVPLPSYPWEHRRYWIETTAQRNDGPRRLLGRRVRSALRSIVFETEWSTASFPYLEDHRAYGTLVAAGACHLAMLGCAVRELRQCDRFEAAGISFPEALVLGGNDPIVVQLVLNPEDRGSHSFEVLSLDGETWRSHAAGTLHPDTVAPAGASVSLDAVRPRCPRELSRPEFYEALWNQGVQYGPAFRWIDRLWQGESEALCRLRVPEGESTSEFVLHPGLIDSCFQLLRAVPALFGAGGAPVVPVAVDSFRVFSAPGAGDLWAHVSLTRESGGEIFTGDLTLFDEAGTIFAEAHGLTAKRAPREFFLRHAANDWLYEVEWQAAPAAAAAYPASCAIVPDHAGVARALAARLEQAGVRVHVTDSLTAAERSAAVVYLRGLDHADDVADHCEEIQRHICGGVAESLPTLEPGSRLWLVTRGAFPQASLWGLGHSLAEEMPEVRTIRVDLDPDTGPVEALVQELRSPGDEDRVRWRGGKRQVQRLVRAAAPRDAATRLREDGTYLITGGLGALGRAVADWMARNGAGRVVLMGRTQREPLESLDPRVTVALGDVASRRDVERVLGGIRAEGPPLRGIVHAAGILDDGFLAQTTWDRFYRVMRPKAQGAWNLHELTSGDPLDCFVMFSSATAVLGSAGQSSHAAANAFLDGLALHRRAAGLPALTLNWGPWSEIGQAAEAHREARLASLGIGSIPPARGIELFGELLHGRSAQTVILPVDWAQWARANGGAVPPFLSHLIATAAAAPANGRVDRNAILQAAPEARGALLHDAIAQDVRGVLQLRDATMDGRRPLLQFGLDSLMALELRRRIDRKLGVAVPLSRILGGMTLDELVAHAAESLAPETDSHEWVELDL